MLTALGLVVLGLAFLTAGGEALVRGATTIARLMRVTPAVIGLTVVAMGTSLPELVVSILAAARGQPDLTVGNVVGSNIFNVTAALGFTALVAVLPVKGVAVKIEWPFMFLASVGAVWAMWDATLSRLEATGALVALVVFSVYSIRLARREVVGLEREEFEADIEGRSFHFERESRVRDLAIATALAVVGGALLLFGGRWLVDGATDISRIAGMSERVIGLTVVAAGTGMPELATSVIAARRRHTDVAVANMIGSNIFNLLAILGITAAIKPIPINPAILSSDVWWMLGTTLLLFVVLRSGMKVLRIEGAILVAVYVAYIATLIGT